MELSFNIVTASRYKLHQDVIYLTISSITIYILHMVKAGTNEKSERKRSRTVRKTITLDGDLAQEVSSFVMEKGSSEKIVFNKLIRIGLIHEKENQGKINEFSLPSFPKGIGDISREELNALLDEI